MALRRVGIAAAGLSIAAGAGMILGGQSGGGRQATRREPQFENEQVRVWKSIIMPEQPLTFHRHDHGRVLIALTDGRLKVVDPDMKEIDLYVWQRGKAYWLAADPPGKLHADLNQGNEPVEVIVVELRRD